MTKQRRTYYTNGINEVRLFPEESVPEGWWKGRVKSTVTTAGKHTYNNGINEAFFFDGQAPEGWIKGRLPNIINSELANKTKKDRDLHWYTNGVEELCLSREDNIPEGWIPGRLSMSDSQKEKLSKSHIGLTRSAETQQKINLSRKLNKKNCRFDSKDEEKFYNYLLSKYDETDIEYQYMDDRYINSKHHKWSCDFYIKSEDLFIELDLFPTHYIEPFDITNKNHVQLLEHCKSFPNNWIEKSMVDIWAGSDVEKLNCAKENNLNYKVYYQLNEIISE